MSRPDFVERAFAVFAADLVLRPGMTLRGGAALDVYDPAPPFTAQADTVTDGYLENHASGVTFLDAASWRHYLPPLIDYAARHARTGNNVVEALLSSLRPPDRDPPRLAALNGEQQAVIVAVLEFLAFDPASAHQELACRVLEEWWIPDAQFRPKPA